MKSILKLSTVAGLVFAANVGMAKEPKVSLVVNEETKSLVFRQDSNAEETSIKLKDAQDHVIFFDNYSKGLYAKSFNVTSLEEGKYFLITEDDIRAFVYTINIGKKDMEIVKRVENTKPVFRTDGEKLFLNLLNLDANTVGIKVFDSDNRILYKEMVEGTTTVEKAFNFEDAFADTYKVMVKDGDEVYYEYITIK
ncbi:MAG: hypothetical protein AB3N14_14740 [Flavobacteriaceae bacterium]